MNDRIPQGTEPLRRQAMGYEQHPARCVNCARYRPPVHGVPGERAYSPPWCEMGEFVVAANGVCDEWRGGQGETLDDASSPLQRAMVALVARVDRALLSAVRAYLQSDVDLADLTSIRHRLTRVASLTGGDTYYVDQVPVAHSTRPMLVPADPPTRLAAVRIAVRRLHPAPLPPETLSELIA